MNTFYFLLRVTGYHKGKRFDIFSIDKFFYFYFLFAAINPDETAVQNLSASTFILSPTGDSLALNISWQEPSFNFSVLSRYQITYTVGSNNNDSVENTVSLSV